MTDRAKKNTFCFFSPLSDSTYNVIGGTGDPDIHEIFTQCCVNVGTASTTLTQSWMDVPCLLGMYNFLSLKPKDCCILL